MKRKIVGIFVMALFIVASIVPVTGSIDTPKNKVTEKNTISSGRSSNGLPYCIEVWQNNVLLGTVKPYSGTETGALNYGYYNGAAHPHNGPNPAPKESRLYFYDGSDGLSLGMFHNIDEDQGVGIQVNTVVWDISVSGATPSVLLSDEDYAVGELEDLGSYTFHGDWSYRTYGPGKLSNTDGGVIGEFTCGAQIDIKPTQWGDIVSWDIYSFDGCSVNIDMSHTLTLVVNCKPYAYSWPMFHHDTQHTGYIDGVGAITTPIKKWSHQTYDAYSSPAIGDVDYDGEIDVVVGGASAPVNKVYCLDGQTGNEKWSHPLGQMNWVYSSPALGDIQNDTEMEVFVGCIDGNVYCLRGSNGDVEWSYTTGGWVYSSPALGDVDDAGWFEVVVGSWDGKVYCLNSLYGTLKWSFQTGDHIFSSPALGDVDGDSEIEVLVGSWDGKVYCLDGSTGGMEWSYTTGGRVDSSPALGDVDNDGKIEVVVGSDDENIYCLDGSTGTKEWSYQTYYFIDSSPVLGDVDGDNEIEVVISSYDGKVHCLDGSPPTADGFEEWYYTLPMGGAVRASPALGDVDNDCTIEIVVGDPYDIYCLDGAKCCLELTQVSGGPTGPLTASFENTGNIACQDIEYEFTFNMNCGFILSGPTSSLIGSLSPNNVVSVSSNNVLGLGCGKVTFTATAANTCCQIVVTKNIFVFGPIFLMW